MQSMQFLPSDAGPCWMSGAQREATRKDRPSGKTVKSARRVAELKKDLYLSNRQESPKAGRGKRRGHSRSFSSEDSSTHQRS